MMASRRNVVFLALALLVVGGAIAGGLRVLDSPGEARLRQFDARRIADLQDIQRAIDLRWQSQKTLPATLDELVAQSMPPLPGRDPVNGRPYEYSLLSEKRYELCADFARGATPPGARPARDFWWHDAGRHCFRLEPRDLLRYGAP